MTNILIATAAIVIATPYALDLYGNVTGTTPLRSAATSIPGKLEPYTHRPLPLASSSYYPDPKTASAHKWLQIGLPASLVGSGGSEEEKLKKLLRIRSVYIKEPSLVIERAYTPLYDTLPGSYSAALSGSTPEQRQMLDLLVKRYPDGELGKMLHRAIPNPTVPQLEVRGPVDTWSFERDSAAAGVPERIVMVVGGTGITPAYQLLTNLFGRPDATTQARLGGTPRIEVLYATQDLESALLLPQLHRLAEANRDKVKVSLFAERLPSTATNLSQVERSALGRELVVSRSKAASSRSWVPFFGSRGSSMDAKLELTSTSAPTMTIPVFESRITQQHLQKVLSPPPSAGSRTLILVSGPDGMVEALAGPKSRDGQTQGRLTGILAAIGCGQEDVFKL